jgi:hypothetical protein
MLWIALTPLQPYPGGVRQKPRDRPALGAAADYGYCASHSRLFWAFRLLHAIFAPDGTPRAIALCSPKQGEREVALKLLARCRRNAA